MKNNAKAILRQNGIFYLTGLLFILGIKLFYSKASVPDLKWILAPDLPVGQNPQRDSF